MLASLPRKSYYLTVFIFLSHHTTQSFSNRFGSQQQQQQQSSNDFPGQFGQQFYPGAGGAQFGGFAHQQGFNQGGFGGQQFPFQQQGSEFDIYEEK